MDARGTGDGGHLAKAGIIDGRHPDVWLDGGEWVARGSDVAAGEGVEQRRLANIGEPDNADAHPARLGGV